VFSEGVDAAPDIASFADGPPRQVTDGLRNVDFWHYVLYLPSDSPQTVEFRFDRPEAVTAMNLWISDAYYWAKDIQVILDGDEASALRHTLKPTEERQELALPGRPVKSVTLKALNYQGTSKKDLVTIDEVNLIRRPSPEAVALTTPAGLVKYPLGRGGLVLNQLQWRETPPAELPRNVDGRKVAQIAEESQQKKRAITSSLLRNLGAAFKPLAAPEPAKAKGKR
jgi:hypothetical protein